MFIFNQALSLVHLQWVDYKLCDPEIATIETFN